MHSDGKTYLSAYSIQLAMADGCCSRSESTNPTRVKIGVMKGHDGLYAGPRTIFGINAEATVIGSIGDIRIDQS
jgi:hypothetical protein